MDRERPASPVGYQHVDVFASAPYSGNSLAVFVSPPPLTSRQMLVITQELRHFETIFVNPGATANVVEARVFDLAGELGFAGHPVLGAAAVLHALGGATEPREWRFTLPGATARVRTEERAPGRIAAMMETSRPELVNRLSAEDRAPVAAALDLAGGDLSPDLPLEVWSTGLRYLIVPVRDRGVLARTRIAHSDFTALLARHGAEFAYVLDATGCEGRHWNNDGVLEDIATGSAAGCVAAYLMRHGRARDGEGLILRQGRFAGRSSAIAITAYGTRQSVQRVTVGGDVALVGEGALYALPGESAPELAGAAELR